MTATWNHLLPGRNPWRQGNHDPADTRMKVFVFEHVCGGGMARQELPPDLAAQGGAMLEAAVRDLLHVGVQVRTSVDRRAELHLDGAQVEVVDPRQSLESVFDRIARNCDAALVIAPESDQLLEHCVARLEQLGIPSLGSSRCAIALCSDKLMLADHFRQAQVPSPSTRLFYTGQRIAMPAAVVVVKPRDGAGCENTFLVEDRDNIRTLAASGDWITQPFMAGISVSVSLIIQRDRITPLLAGRQHIVWPDEPSPCLRYDGGSIPLEPSLAARALPLAERAVQSVEGLRGFVGVDLILADEPQNDMVMEINPRLTVSYVALRRLCKSNLAAMMLPPGSGSDDVTLDWTNRTEHFDVAGRCRRSVKS